MILIGSCKSGEELNIAISDICIRSSLIFFDATSRVEKEYIVTNNRFACQECKPYLSNEHIDICNEVI